MGTSNPASLVGTHPAPPPMCEIGKDGYVTRLRGCGLLVSHAADYSLRSFVMFFIVFTTCIFTNNIHDTYPTRRFQTKLCRVPAPLWSRVWSALMRALPLRLCAPVLALTGAECSGLLRSGSDWLLLVFFEQLLHHFVRCRL